MSVEPDFDSGVDFLVVPPDEILQQPWSCIGRVEASPPGGAAFSGVGTGCLVGPKHVLTASHVLEGRFFGDGFRFRFVPGYRGGNPIQDPTGGAVTRANFTGRIVTGNPSGKPGSAGLTNNVFGWDFVVCELDNRIGDVWGYLGVIWGGEGFYRDHRWTSVGYPTRASGWHLENEWPIRFPGIDVDDVEADRYGSKEIQTEDYTLAHWVDQALGDRNEEGWSGGPLLGFINDEWRVAGVMSGKEQGDILDLDGELVFAGGKRLGDVHREAYERWAHYDWSADAEDMTRTFGYSQPKGAVAACSWEPGRLDLFWRDDNDHLKHAWYPYDGGWSWEQDLTADFGYAPIASAPAACSWEPGRLDVFWRDANNHLKHAWYPYGDNWSWEQDLTADFGYAPIASAPAACSWGPGRLDVFWMADSPQHLKHAWYPYGEDWSFEQDLTAQFGYQPMAGGPGACSWEPGRLDVFWKGPGNHLKHAWYPYGEDWSFEQDLTTQFGFSGTVFTPAACSWAPGRMDVFWQGNNKPLRHAWYPYGDDWSFEQNMTTAFPRHGNIASAPTACSWGHNRIDLFWRGLNGHLQHTWFGADV